MTHKQNRYLQGIVEGKTKMQSALEAGYSENTAKTASQNIETQEMKCKLAKLMKEQGITLELIIDKLKEGLEAEMPVVKWNENFPDNEVRLKYLVLTLKLSGHL